MLATKRLRCAIYTRKSSEEGLEQGFNSLHAQREACEAYVLSQVGEGWTALPTVYDDGGFSGGSMDRPALKALLTDIERGRIDIVVVYKVDRLTRALSDFARIVEIFDAKGVSFVSVTQAFNTTSSMGRLTLNVLLSFAQFEREVTGERIRDKIAASKAKGLWMGGNVALGYDVPDQGSRVLKVNPAEADTVRLIFRRYLELGTVRKLAEDLDLQGIRTKQRTSINRGKVVGGGRWLEGPLHHFLKNRLYRGDIVHRGKVYPGQHEAVVDEATFDAVQELLQRNTRAYHDRGRVRSGSPLMGKVFDDRGHRMSPASAKSASGRINRYYVSQAVVRRDRGEAGSLPRTPAEPLEALVMRELAKRVDTEKAGDQPLSALAKVVVSTGGVEVTFDPAMLRIEAVDAGDPGAPVFIRIATTLKTFGGSKQLVDAIGASVVAQGPDLPLQRAIGRARAWALQIEHGERVSSDDIATAEGVQPRYVEKVLGLAWLAPDITEAVLGGRRLRDFTLTELIASEIPASWEDQRAALALV